MAYNLRARPGIQVETLGPIDHERAKDSSRRAKQKGWSDPKIVTFLLLFRWLNVALVQTSFVPDEYWQSLEVAHKMVFGYGYLTWEWQSGLRGYTYPALFAAQYKILAMLNLDYPLVLIFAPRILQATFSAIGDFCLYKVSCHLHGHSVGKWTLIFNLASWYVFYSATRTLTNTMEACLTSVGLYFFPWPKEWLYDKKIGQTRNSWLFVAVVALACLVRPTAVIQWLPLCLWHVNLCRQWNEIFPSSFFIALLEILRVVVVFYLPVGGLDCCASDAFGLGVGTFVPCCKGEELSVGRDSEYFSMKDEILEVVAEGAPVCQDGSIWNGLVGAILISLLVDRMFYGHWVCVQKNFIDFNFINDFGAFYGTHSWHWYFTQGFPVVMGTHIPCFLMGAKMAFRRHSILLFTIVWTICIYSFASHKEFRFIYPVVPICMLFCGMFMEHVHQTGKSTPLVLYLLLNIPACVFFGLLHQRGVLDVMGHARQLAQEHVAGQQRSLLFLMPCHSTPYYSFVHEELPMRFLECPPNLQRAADYVDESSQFYSDPVGWLRTEYKDSPHLPTHLILFDVLQPDIQDFLTENRYQEVASYFHTHLPEGKMGRRVLVFAHGEERLDDDR
ncbi:GPI mannosyltransferase 3-like [Diadema antillarum]|uniref:GPI mannosyltransferase 3-like n=1 Tax=Diadema antillarum TaxID=105358 RepID=UPI003A8B33B6